ncbi:MFS transporter [Sphingobacterium faecium NBRC 15299]|uniref:MFS transporter n=1 Tax=Sphingobacterium faecium TaxID=34087 RepID=UPI000D38A7BE|nr:MFS transporter [Sphingobacterium faecium]PTX09655.1 sugar phosphate permease [Sphingobacterium faecium]GEM63729.1 MFS transporter [Sphingobacterium faecium NBRC 15299]
MEQSKAGAATKLYILAWVFGLIFYFLDYVIRSSPAVMLPQLAEQFKVSPVGLVTIIGTYYYTYSTVSLLAGLALDKFGAKYSLFIGTFILGLGCLLFVLSNSFSGNAGRLLQGAGCAFAFPGCVYLASKGFSAKSLATAIGFTQCIGMLGGSAGQFIVGPWIEQGVNINHFWLTTGLVTILVAFGLLLVIPKNADQVKPVNHIGSKGILWPYKVVFSNPQSWLCGIISGLLFAPTTIFAMTWGVAFFEQDKDFSFHTATIASAMIPMGWVLGCPLLGYITDRIAARKPVLLAGAMVMILAICQIIFMPDLLSAYTTNFIFGVASGAAMIPYSVIKESNPDEVKGSATGAINFITFGVTTLLNPIFSKFFGQTLSQGANKSTHFQLTGLFWIAGIGLAIILMFFLKETGQRKVNKLIS